MTFIFFFNGFVLILNHLRSMIVLYTFFMTLRLGIKNFAMLKMTVNLLRI